MDTVKKSEKTKTEIPTAAKPAQEPMNQKMDDSEKMEEPFNGKTFLEIIGISEASADNSTSSSSLSTAN